MHKIIFSTIAFVLAATAGFVLATDGQNHLAGKIIALDAGHGSTETDFGAQYPPTCADAGSTVDCLVYEKDVNRYVVVALGSKLTALDAKVVIVKRLSTRRDRVNDAVAQCAALDVDGIPGPDNRKCDVLVSVHHNGNASSTYDGTLTIYTQNSDKPLAQSLLGALAPLTDNSEGMLSGGYGMTVFKNLVSTITEAYYITNDCEAKLYLHETTLPSCSQALYPDGENRVEREADLQVQGLRDYFANQPPKKGSR